MVTAAHEVSRCAPRLVAPHGERYGGEDRPPPQGPAVRMAVPATRPGAPLRGFSPLPAAASRKSPGGGLLRGLSPRLTA